MNAVGWTLLVLFLTLANTMASLLSLQNFLTDNPAIADDESMLAYKQLVRQQMYQAVGQFVALWVAVVFGLYALIENQWDSPMLLLGLALGVAVFLADRSANKSRAEARSLPAADKGLEGLYNAISQIWVNKTLPDF